MAKLTGMKRVNDEVGAKVQASIRASIPGIITSYLDENLNKQVTATNKPLPTKADSTKRAYAKRGWNQEKWFVRTGKSSKLVVKNIKNGVCVSPRGVNILKMVKLSDEFYVLDDIVINKIVDVLRRSL